MARELPRTLRSLCPSYQVGVDADEYEVIVVDNGSRDQSVVELAAPPDLNLRVLQVRHPTVSPAPAVNLGLDAARAPDVGVMVDGARMASPGLVRWMLAAHRTSPRNIAATLGWHLGPDVQSRSIHEGYDAEREDRLLAQCGWQGDGYALFSISVFAVSSQPGWFKPFSESNAWSMPSEMWDEIDGYDEAFNSPGGGLVNHDALSRACALPDSHLVVILGEGTFHQVHGGVATNASVSPFNAFQAEHVALRGHPHRRPRCPRSYIGAVDEAARPFLMESLRQLDT